MRETILGNNNGCTQTISVVITTIIALFVGFSSTIIPTETQLVEENFPFVLTESGVDYTFRETLNCQFVIAGNLEYLDNDSSDNENLVIILQSLGTYDERPPATIGVGTDPRFGENGWSQLLVGNYWYLVWVYDLASDAPISDEVLVDGLDCANERTLALVNFRQVLPLG